MNLSLILVIVLVAVVIPWIIRSAFIKPVEAPAELAISEEEVEEGFSDVRVLPSRHERATADLGFKESAASVLSNTGSPKVVVEKHLPTGDRLEIIHIMAPAGKKFVGYELLQTLQTAGFTYGPMRIFHYSIDDTIAFSLSSAVEPGVFNIEEIGAFATPGLTLFLDKTKVLNPQKTIALMYDTAQQIAEDLGGELRNAKRQKIA